jgi:hypothetical protein
MSIKRADTSGLRGQFSGEEIVTWFLAERLMMVERLPWGRWSF